MMSRLAWLLLCIPAVASAGPAAPSPDLSAALQKAKVGATLRVETTGGQHLGRFAGVDRNGLELREERGRVSIPLESVKAASRLDSARNKGILWGVLVGVAGGLAVASQRDDATISEGNHDAMTYAYHGAVGALLGGAIGGVIGSRFGTWQPIYP